MKCKRMAMIAAITGVLTVMGGWAIAAQDKYTVKVPNGLSFADFRGYEDWQAVGPSHTDATNIMRLIVANPAMITAYKAGVPGNGKPFPEGSKIAKIEWRPKKVTDPPFSANSPDTVPGDLAAVEVIEKDTKRFPDTHGWGYATFEYDTASGTFTPATEASKPPQGHDAKCGATCHNLAAAKDYIFTPYAKR
jgi:hypothetical protein